MNKNGFFFAFGLGLLVMAFLIGAGYYLLFYSSSDDFQVVENCGILVEKDRDDCCSEQNKNNITIQCRGDWKYFSDGCRFVCDSEISVCTQDVMDCGSGVYVSRDSQKNCTFPACPVINSSG